MKKRLLFFTVCLVFAVSCNEKHEKEEFTIIELNNFDNFEFVSFSNSQIKQAEVLYNQLVDTNVIFDINTYSRGGIPSIANRYKYDNVESEKLKNEDIIKLLYGSVARQTNDTTIYWNNTNFSVDNEIRFLESWSYKNKPFKFQKEVQYISPVVARYSNGSEGEEELFLGLIPLYYLEFNKADASEDITKIENICYVTYPVQPHNYLFNENAMLSFLDFIFGAIEEGTITAYLDYEKNTKVSSIADFNYEKRITNRFDFNKEIALPDTTVIASLNINSIKSLTFVENWEFNIEKQFFKKEVNAIGFGTKAYTLFENNMQDKKELKQEPSFWVFFE